MIFDIQTARLLYYFIHRRTALKLNLLHYLARSSHVVVSPVYTAFT